MTETPPTSDSSRAAADDPRARLIATVAGLRAAGAERADAALAALCAELEADPSRAEALGADIRAALRRSRSTELLVEAGIPAERGFLDGLLLCIGRKLLPEVPPEGSLRGLLRDLFHGPADHVWMAAIDPETARRFLHAVHITAESVAGITPQLAAAIRALAHHVASLGLSPDITRLMPEVDDPDSPFLALSHAVLSYVESFENDVEGDEEPLLDATLAVLDDCRAVVRRLRAEKHRFGTSLRLTGLTRRLMAQIERLDRLLHLTEPVERDFPRCAWLLAVELVQAEHTRSHIRPHLRASADLLAFQVVEHAARTGSKYITETAGQYGRFLVSSLIGGVVVALFALFKIWLDGDAAPLVEALVFGANYAACFVLIALVGGTLATKQPAMTANTLARTMAPEGGAHDVEALADLIVRVSRSQFVSFVGNVAAALPLGVGLTWLVVALSGAPPADPEKAWGLLAELHPWHSPSIAYAAIAGVFLSTAGLVSGWLDNRNLYRRLPQRIAGHRGLHRLVGPERAARLGGWVGAKLGAMGGNIFLGFCLGSAGSIGLITGLPIDIRHIAFASAHFGMALATLGAEVPAALVAQVALGVGLIGLFNFLVSFGLTLTVALTARRFSFGESRALLWAVARRFLRRPWRFFLPPRGSAAPARPG